MCITSAVFEEYGKTPIQPWIPPTWVPVISPSITISTVKIETPLDLFEELVRVASRLDRALGLPDCEDPAKAAWLEKVRDAVRQHEAAQTEKRLSAK